MVVNISSVAIGLNAGIAFSKGVGVISVFSMEPYGHPYPLAQEEQKINPKATITIADKFFMV